MQKNLQAFSLQVNDRFEINMNLNCCCFSKRLKGRVRNGKYFIVNRNILSSIQCSEVVDVYDEFIRHHQNAHAEMAEFVAVKLSDEQVSAQRDRIRMASFRWEGTRSWRPGSSDFHIPSNYVWFLEHIKKHNHIGWLDFISNVACGVPVTYTVGYMGKMYAEMITVSNWMFQPSLLPESMRRCWIFQETAFGSLDETGIDFLLEFLQKLGSRVLDGDKACLTGDFASTSIAMACLLERRGWSRFFAQVKPSLPFHEYGDGTFSALMQKRVEGRKDIFPERGNSYGVEPSIIEDLDLVFQPPRNLVSIAVFHILDYFTRGLSPEANPMQSAIKDLLCNTWHSLNNHESPTLESFGKLYGRSVVMAYVSCEVTYENDRDDAVTAVARAIVKDEFNEQDLDAERLMSIMWQQSIKATLDRGSSVVAFPIEDSKATPVMRFKGLCLSGKIHGTPLLGSDSHSLSYRTQYGNKHTFSESNHPQINRFGVTHVRGKVWRHDLTGEEAQFFICEAPKSLREIEATVIILLCRSRDMAPLNIRVHVRAGGPEFNSSSWPTPAETVILS